MKNFFLLLLLVITLSSCYRNSDMITIEGESQTDFDDKYVFLTRDGSSIQKILLLITKTKP